MSFRQSIYRTNNLLSPSDSLTVRDNRTGHTIDIPINHNSIPATAFKALKAPQDASNPGHREEDDFAAGLRVYDPAFMNTAALSSKITYIDGEKGTLMHRGYPIGMISPIITSIPPSQNTYT